MKKTLTFSILLVLLTFTTWTASAGEAHFEVLAGGHYSSLFGVSSGSTLGVRGGYRFSDRWSLEGTLSRVDVVDVAFPFVRARADSTQLDVSAKWTFRPNRKYQLYLYTGPGMSFYDVSVNEHRVVSIDNSSAWHLGMGVRVPFGERMYLRPDFRFRWSSDPYPHDGAAELTLGLGWRFGGVR